MYFVYILQSLRDFSYYIGYTSDINRRFTEHNCGFSRYTKRKVPWDIVYLEEFRTRSGAMRREKQLKSYKGNKEMLRSVIGY